MSRLRLFRPEGSPAADSPRILSFAFYAPLIRAERALAQSRGRSGTLARSAPEAKVRRGVMAVIREDGQRVPVAEAPQLFVRRFDLAGE